MKNGLIELLRFIFAINIMFFHAYLLGHGSLFNGARLWISVEFFSIVTGYFMVASLYKNIDKEGSIGEKTIRFLKKKIGVILPEYVIAWIISFLSFCLIIKTYNISEMVHFFFKDVWELLLLGITGVSDVYINNPLWYISAMIFASAILYPVCLKFKDSYIRVFSWLVGIAIFGLLINNYKGLDHVFRDMFIFRKGFYRVFAGMSLGIALNPVVEYLNQKKMGHSQRILKNICMVLMWLTVMLLVYGTSEKYILPFVILLIWMALALTLSNYNQHILIDNRFLGFLGKMSMPLYLVHFPCARLVHYYLKNVEIKQEFIIYILVSFAVALIVYLLGKLIRKIINIAGEPRREKL